VAKIFHKSSQQTSEAHITKAPVNEHSKTGDEEEKGTEVPLDETLSLEKAVNGFSEISGATVPPSSTGAKEESEAPIKDDEIKEMNFQPQNTDISLENDGDENLELKIEKAAREEMLEHHEYKPLGDYDPTLDLSSYKLPTFDLLDEHDSQNGQVGEEELISNKNRIVKTLEDYKIQIKSIKATVGPTITLYEIVPAPGIRISKIKNLEDDIALSLAALGIRIIAPIPGRGTIGIEVPNSEPEIVSMRSIITSRKFQNSKFELPIAFGKTISNETYVLDLTKAPHMLVAGATGQGKSVGLNAIITSLLYKKHPSQLKFVLVDPKKVELNIYSKIEKHFLAKLPDEEESIITDVQRVVSTLNSLTIEMDQRYDLLKKAHARNMREYNHKFVKRQLNPEKGHRFLPYIVVIIDEFADLIMTAGKDVEMPIARIAQLARAVGIHMIIATQRPSTNIITGVIKANFPTRVAFKVASMIDSRTILDSPGANQLIGRGDMLITQGSELIRVQCAFVDTPEVEKINDYIGAQQGYPSALILPEYIGGDNEGAEPGEVDLSKRDPMFEEAARVVVANQSGSTSLIQRRFSIGYNRAGRIIDQLEAAGVVGPFEGSKARQVLIPDEYELEKIFNTMR
jgi:S-DNA-T family DNA segregation ATPase FtsK/SpoIIIE